MTPAPEAVLPILERTPRVLDALLRDLPDAWTLANEGGETWTPKAVIAHYIHTDRHNWIPRIQLIMESTTPPRFADMSRVPDSEDPNRKSISQLLALHEFKLKGADLDRTALHPTFGEVTLGNLLATWAAHDLTHLHQLSRTLAHQLRDDIGPWTVFLGVMHCTGHRS